MNTHEQFISTFQTDSRLLVDDYLQHALQWERAKASGQQPHSLDRTSALDFPELSEEEVTRIEQYVSEVALA